MRISRLAQDNPRMQGAKQRVWYRQHSPDHLRAVERLVNDVLVAQRRGTPPRAIVLGAGACTELPLERLARACESILLVDIDVAGMLRARDELPAAVRERVNVLALDLTGGVSAALATELRAQPWADLAQLSGPNAAAPLDAAAACLDHCPIPDPPFDPRLAPAGYDLVISDFVLTQLFSLPTLDVVDMLTVVAPAAVDQREAHPRYRDAAHGFRRRIALAHLSLLSMLLAPAGAGLLMSDITGYLLPARSGPHAAPAADSLPVLPPEALDLPTEVASRFEVIGQPHTWRWLVSAPTANLPGRAYDVLGVVFRPR